jgi:hypothetical protein
LPSSVVSRLSFFTVEGARCVAGVLASSSA